VGARHPAQAAVEAALTSVLCVSLLLLVVSAGWWAHAQNVVAAATREGARAASALGGSTADGLAVANQLLVTGLGDSASRVQVTPNEDPDSVTISAAGSWPLAAGLGMELDLPLGSSSRMLKDEWRP
jgi:Flp pilus assembly protein TadG